MKVIYGKLYLRELHLAGKTSEKKRRFQPDIIKRYRKVVNIMIAVKDINSLAKINSLRYEKLIGDKQGLSSLRVSDKYRIEFEEINADGEICASMCRLTELSNHYK
ncbi:MAG: addiction module killer protein [Bacteroidales bacterium]|nr:addiction module killer protein [Bacteroidales bacterium]